MPLSSTMSSAGSPPEVKQYSSIPQVLDIPHLILMQLQSFERFKGEGIAEVFRDISPIKDFTESKYELSFLDHSFEVPKYTPEECKQKEITYCASLWITIQLLVKETGEIKEEKIFMGDIPIMTDNGTFIVNGAERVVVSQLVRSPGAYFVLNRDIPSDRQLCSAKLIPYRGAWLEFETSAKNIISVKVDRKRKVSVTIFLRALGITKEEELHKLFGDADIGETHKFIQSTLEKDVYSDEREGQFRKDEMTMKAMWEWLKPGQKYDPHEARLIAPRPA